MKHGIFTTNPNPKNNKPIETQFFPTPKKVKVVLPLEKVFASVLWDTKDVILIKNLQEGHTVTGQNYSKRLHIAVKGQKVRNAHKKSSLL